MRTIPEAGLAGAGEAAEAAAGAAAGAAAAVAGGGSAGAALLPSLTAAALALLQLFPMSKGDQTKMHASRGTLGRGRRKQNKPWQPQLHPEMRFLFLEHTLHNTLARATTPAARFWGETATAAAQVRAWVSAASQLFIYYCIAKRSVFLTVVDRLGLGMGPSNAWALGRSSTGAGTAKTASLVSSVTVFRACKRFNPPIETPRKIGICVGTAGQARQKASPGHVRSRGASRLTDGNLCQRCAAGRWRSRAACSWLSSSGSHVDCLP